MDKPLCRKGHIVSGSNKAKTVCFRGCRTCMNEYHRKWKKENMKKVRSYIKKRKKNLTPEKIKEIRKAKVKNVQDWHKRHPEKSEAYRLYRMARKTGKLIVPNICSKCKKKKDRIEGHHTDYSKPLKVKWLCQKCHSLEPKSKYITKKYLYA
jgi:hypothetical protein